jgi:hypothetical protein
MTTDLFLDDNHRVLTTAAFEFVTEQRAQAGGAFAELPDARQRQASDRRPGRCRASDPSATQKQIAHLISRELRETDLVAEEDTGRLWLALLDVDLQKLDERHPAPAQTAGRIRVPDAGDRRDRRGDLPHSRRRHRLAAPHRRHAINLIDFENGDPL